MRLKSINCQSIIVRKTEDMHRIKLFVALMMALFVFVPCRGQSDDEVRDSLRFCQSQLEALNSRLDSNEVLLATLRRRMNDLVMLKDSLIAANDLFQRQLQEKNRLMDEQKAAMQEKERLVAEKEELYRQALTNSTVDKAKWEGELKAKEASIDAKSREIAYLQKDIDAKESTLQSQRENYSHLLTEKEYYRHRTAGKFEYRKLRGSGLSVFQTTQIIILPGLPHQQQQSRCFFRRDIRRIKRQYLTYSCYFPVSVIEDLPVYRFRKRRFRQGKPVSHGKYSIR